MSARKPPLSPSAALPADLQRTLDYIRGHPRCRPVDIFEGVLLNWQMTTVHARLRQLLALGLVTGHPVPGNKARCHTVRE